MEGETGMVHKITTSPVPEESETTYIKSKNEKKNKEIDMQHHWIGA